MRPSIEMTPERYERLSRVFDAACDRAGDARARFLDDACGDDATLRRDVEELLAADRKPGGLLDRPFPDLSSAVSPVEGQIGPYRIETKLGEGGTGTVFLAHDTKLNRPVAIKLLAGEVADAAARRRFQQEARLASSLNHPHILTFSMLASGKGANIWSRNTSMARLCETGSAPRSEHGGRSSSCW